MLTYQDTPLMILSSVLSTIGVGLLYTFTPHTTHPKWIGYQALAGIGEFSGWIVYCVVDSFGRLLKLSEVT